MKRNHLTRWALLATTMALTVSTGAAIIALPAGAQEVLIPEKASEVTSAS